ncbi:MarR family winged helix-turn-helix transcriptional regulator [Mycobacterium sp.]|uniref:MarR family winged helix-turn-helix transcriptional regulator n=1 Tax=Mycobacterium sp. TaxID=1785 RepID=UPI0025DD843A|nr:MarR family winged helix-turn-helix transcriptional regulator [Mycobacterium sp.]
MADLSRPSTAAELSRILGPLRRVVLRATRATAGLPDLPDAHIEILRTVASDPEITPRAIADRLGLARPTVSNVIQTMKRDRLLALNRSDDDARVVHVTVTRHAARLLQRYDTASERLLSEALGQLTASHRAAITAAIPALIALQSALGLAPSGTDPVAAHNQD